MTARQIDCFLTLARVLNFRKAAELLGISQPTLSEQMRQLEKAVGVPLLARERGKVQLTKQGAVMLEAFTTAAEAIEQGVKTARGGETAKDGTLRLGVLQGWSPTKVAALQVGLRSYQQDRSHLRVEILRYPSGELKRSLAEGTLHLALLPEYERAWAEETGLKGRKLQEAAVALFSRTPIERDDHGRPVINTLLVARNEEKYTNTVLERLKRCGITYRTIEEEDSINTMLSCIDCRKGAAVLAEICVLSGLPRGNSIVLEGETMGVFIFWQDGNREVERFLAHMPALSTGN